MSRFSSWMQSWPRYAAYASFALLCAAPAFAQDESGPADTATGWIFRCLNFLIVAGAVWYLVRKAGVPRLRERARQIGISIREAAEELEKAAAELRAAEGKLAGIAAEIAQMREAASHDAAAEAERLHAMIRSELEKIDAAARAEISAAERAARQELKITEAQLAVGRAEALLREKINRASGARLVDAFVTDLAGGAG